MSSATPHDEIPGSVLAAIAVAVQAALEDEPHVIHGIRSADPLREGLAWSAEGRRSVHTSKTFR